MQYTLQSMRYTKQNEKSINCMPVPEEISINCMPVPEEISINCMPVPEETSKNVAQQNYNN